MLEFAPLWLLTNTSRLRYFTAILIFSIFVLDLIVLPETYAVSFPPHHSTNKLTNAANHSSAQSQTSPYVTKSQWDAAN